MLAQLLIVLHSSLNISLSLKLCFLDGLNIDSATLNQLVDTLEA